jgi:hypothetical protein
MRLCSLITTFGLFTPRLRAAAMLMTLQYGIRATTTSGRSFLR